MEDSLQAELEKKGVGKVDIVRLENTQMGSLGLSGYDKEDVKYQLLPSPTDPNLPVEAWPGREGTAEKREREKKMNFRTLAGSALSEEGVLVGPAVKYASQVVIDKTGVALWRRVVKAE